MLTLDGVPLDDPANRFYVLRDNSQLRNPPGVVVNDVNVPGQHGAIPSNTSVYGPGSVTLNMRVRGGDYPSMMSNYNLLMATVGIRRLPRTLVDTEIAQAVGVQLTAATPLQQVLRKMGDCALTFAVPRSFWRDSSDITVDLGTSAGSRTPSELQGGSAPILDPVFVTVGNGASTDFRVTDDTSLTYVRWVGTVPSGQSVRIEPDTASAWLVPTGNPWNGGTDVSGLLTVGPGQFVLTPGAGFTITKAGSTGTQVRARRAYL